MAFIPPRGHDLSDQDIVNMAMAEDFRVHKFRWNELSLRRRCNHLVERGLLKRVGQSGDEYIFRTVSPHG